MNWFKRKQLELALLILIKYCHGQSKRAGWWHDLETGAPLKRNKGEMLMLVTTELAEAMEGVRKGLPDDHLPEYGMEDVELADALVRIFDYIGGHNLRTVSAFTAKLIYNANRADHKIENRRKVGGKKV